MSGNFWCGRSRRCWIFLEINGKTCAVVVVVVVVVTVVLVLVAVVAVMVVVVVVVLVVAAIVTAVVAFVMIEDHDPVFAIKTAGLHGTMVFMQGTTSGTRPCPKIRWTASTGTCAPHFPLAPHSVVQVHIFYK